MFSLTGDSGRQDAALTVAEPATDDERLPEAVSIDGDHVESFNRKADHGSSDMIHDLVFLY
ncbi:hypothetical protein [Methylobacterium terrae]|uniref:hypothetical protein n=1 Tax=Methylobacterium terrae TaxID=2202827 RepID=UPI0013A564FD|nr:hypothetical protein [Methylobacterium terrae]